MLPALRTFPGVSCREKLVGKICASPLGPLSISKKKKRERERPLLSSESADCTCDGTSSCAIKVDSAETSQRPRGARAVGPLWTRITLHAQPQKHGEQTSDLIQRPVNSAPGAGWVGCSVPPGPPQLCTCPCYQRGQMLGAWWGDSGAVPPCSLCTGVIKSCVRICACCLGERPRLWRGNNPGETATPS